MNSIPLQRMQTSSILSQVVAEGLVTSDFHPFKTHLPWPWSTYCKPSIFDMEKYGWPTIGVWSWTWRNFDIYFEPIWSSNFSLFLFLTPLYIFLIYDVFLKYSYTRFKFKLCLFFLSFFQKNKNLIIIIIIIIIGVCKEQLWLAHHKRNLLEH